MTREDGTMDELLEQLTENGYEVGLAFEAEGIKVYGVSGHGIVKTYLREDDAEAWASLADAAAHAERVAQVEDPERADRAREAEIADQE